MKIYPRQLKADDFLRAALRRGPLVKSRRDNWRFGRREFNGKTVRRAIDRGEAIRDGKFVRAI